MDAQCHELVVAYHLDHLLARVNHQKDLVDCLSEYRSLQVLVFYLKSYSEQIYRLKVGIPTHFIAS